MFDWQTEDESLWEDGLPATKTAESRRKRPWFIFLFILTAVIGLSSAVYRQIQRQVVQATTAVEQEVLAAHYFVQEVAVQKDRELFLSQLSGSDLLWTDAQLRLLERGLLFDRAPLGLSISPLSSSQDITITVAPGLEAAEVMAVYPYTFLTAEGITETVPLQQTAVYRLGKNHRWLLSPPTDDFWGGWATFNTSYLALTYPKRDAVWAERLAFDLDQLIRHTCRELPDLHCQPDLHLSLRFDNQPGSFLDSADFATFIQQDDRLELPTPTLMGLPIDEAGYGALYQGYGVRVISAVITHQVGYQCCDHLPVYDALLHKQLNQLGLLPWPLNPARYEQILNEFNGRMDNQGWQEKELTVSEREQHHLYSLVDFLLETAKADITLTYMQRQLKTADSYLGWLFTILPDMENVTYHDTLWHNYVYLQSSIGQSPPPIPLPTDIILTCKSRNSATLYHFEVEANSWAEVLQRSRRQLNSYVSLYPFAVPDSYLIVETWFDLESAAPVSQMTGWQPTGEIEITGPTPGYYEVLGVGASQRYLPVYSFDRSGPTRVWVIDTTACLSGHCQLQSVLSWPIWSPDESQMLMLVDETPEQIETNELYAIYWSGGIGQSPIKLGYGFAAAWIDNGHYILIRSGTQGQREVVMATVQDDVQHVLFEEGAFLPLMPGIIERPSALSLSYVEPRPGYPSQYLVTLSALDINSQRFHFLWQEGRAVFLPLTNSSSWVRFSPNGRWLVEEPLSMSGGHVRLLDLEEGQETGFYKDSLTDLRWSVDGNWLVYNNRAESLITLLAPAHNYQRLIPYYLPNCWDSLVWLQ